MNYKKFLGKTVEVSVLDHEYETGVDIKLVCAEKNLEAKIYGVLTCENTDYIVVSSWVCSEGNDVYRLLKSCIKNIRVLK